VAVAGRSLFTPPAEGIAGTVGSRDLGAPDRRLCLWAEEWRADISSLVLAVLGPDEQQRTSALSLVGHAESPMHQQWDRGVLKHMSCHAAED
jgi:hypothetical protein